MTLPRSSTPFCSNLKISCMVMVGPSVPVISLMLVSRR